MLALSIAIIANPYAGRGRGKRVTTTITNTLREKNIDFELLTTQYRMHAAELAFQASQKHEIVAALGGDGTINEVLNGMWKTQAKLGIIPGGTGNDYARGLGIPRDPIAALDVILHGNPIQIDVVEERDRNFGVVSTLGFPTTVLEYTETHRDSWIKGPAVFAAGIAYTLHNLRTYHVKITADQQEREFDAVGIVLMNMPYGGGGLKFAPEARYDDGLIWVVVIKEISKLRLLRAFPLVYFGKHTNHPCVDIFTASHIRIETEGELKKSYDGDVMGITPLDARIHPRAAWVMTNQKKA